MFSFGKRILIHRKLPFIKYSGERMIKRMFKSIIAFLLIATTLFGATVSVFAATGEEYISELRLVYAEDYDEAKAIIADSEFKNYKILK